MSPPEFAELETSIVNGSVWKAGGPNSVLQSQAFRVRVSSLCLTDGDPYEIEGAMSSADETAAALALVQDVARVSSQLKISPPVSADLLAEYQPARVTRLGVDYVPVLLVDEESAEDRFGLRRDFNDPTLLEGMYPWRRLVRALRAEGWRGAIRLPGPRPDVSYVVIPRRFAGDGSLRIEWTGQLGKPTPRTLVEYAIGERREFPVDLDVIGGPLERRKAKASTRSWRPPSPLRRIEEAS
jgi:hypothetical protein